MHQVHEWVGVTRQACYAYRRRRTGRQSWEAALHEQVQALRQRHPRLGGRKLLYKLQEWLADNGLIIGRDRFFALLRRWGMLVAPPRHRRRTTWAGTWRGHNLLAETPITRPNQAWVSDITYIETEHGFLYLVLITDVFSRRVMGWDLSPSLAVEGTLRALKRAIDQAKGQVAGLIHHSDHGIQYTCHAFRTELDKWQIRSSMGEVGNCYDNAIAERVNGILKLEYGLEHRFVSAKQAQRATREAVWLYNHERPHLSLAYQEPHQVYIKHLSLAID